MSNSFQHLTTPPRENPATQIGHISGLQALFRP
jgi:hypothetical protein